MENLPLSVSDAIALVNQTLEFAYPTIVVEGEVSGYKVNQGKFVFFDLKDETGTLGCFMMLFQQQVLLEDGMTVRVVAAPKLTLWGKFSLTVRTVRPVGEGSLKRAFDLLHAKLAKEGLFADDRKRQLPMLPERIGVISSVDAAGYKDFIKILDERFGGLDITVAHTQVQGAAAAGQIEQALLWFNKQQNPVEVIVIVRGGGSTDDLSVFNEEPLVRALSVSRIPTLVGVGHEVDVTLAELVADVRASTPTHAAQLLVPDRRAMRQTLAHTVDRLLSIVKTQLLRRTEAVEYASQRAYRLIRIRYELLTERLRYIQRMVVQLDPRTVLSRGYALVFDAAGRVLQSRQPVMGDLLTLETGRYIIKTEVKDVKRKES